MQLWIQWANHLDCRRAPRRWKAFRCASGCQLFIGANMDNRRNQTVSEPLKVFEASGVEPVFLTQEQAIDYATCRACFCSGGIRILGADFVRLSGSAEWLNRLGKNARDVLVQHVRRFGWDCVSDVATLYDFRTGKHGFSNCTIMLRAKQIIGYNVLEHRLSLGAAFAVLPVTHRWPMLFAR
jgi:hypothetical protein